MKKISAFLVLPFFLPAFFVANALAQDDETRQTSGLPMMIGENTSDRNRAPLSGKLTVLGLDPTQKKPNIFVIVYFSGAVIDKRQVNDAGYFYVPGVPRQGSILAVEMDGIEIGRYQLPPSVLGSIRQDLEINWAQAQSPKGKPGVISVKNNYQRSPENEKIFERAMLAEKDKNSGDAVKLFQQIVENDPKDFVAWAELGTLFFVSEKFSDAENAYNKALEIKPDFLIALINSGKLFLAQKQPEKSIPFLTKAVELEPEAADAQHFLGEAYLQIKKGSLAVVHLNQALKLAPIEKAEIHLRLAALYNAAGLKPKAVEEYKMFLEKVPKYPEREKIEKYIRENSPK